MYNFGFARLATSFFGGCVVALAFIASPILAQAPESTETVSTAPYPFGLLIATLIFALLALAIVFVYIYFVQKKFYETSEGLGRLGRAVQVTSVSTFVAPTGLEGGLADATGAEAVELLQVTGPASVPVGVESTEFSVIRVEGGALVNEAVWSVDPPNAAIVNPQQGAKVKVIAAVPGVFKLIAEVTTPKPGSAELPVAAVAPQANAVQLPFIGEAYGSITIAIILIAAIMMLSLFGTLSGEGAATLLGALLGYIFGVTKLGASRQAGGEQSTE